MENRTLKIGDYVVYRGCWGTGPETVAQVVGLTLTEHPRQKYGDEVQVVTWAAIEANQVCIDLNDHHWVYASQIVRKAEPRIQDTPVGEAILAAMEGLPEGAQKRTRQLMDSRIYMVKCRK